MDADGGGPGRRVEETVDVGAGRQPSRHSGLENDQRAPARPALPIKLEVLGDQLPFDDPDNAPAVVVVDRGFLARLPDEAADGKSPRRILVEQVALVAFRRAAPRFRRQPPALEGPLQALGDDGAVNGVVSDIL